MGGTSKFYPLYKLLWDLGAFQKGRNFTMIVFVSDSFLCFDLCNANLCVVVEAVHNVLEGVYNICVWFYIVCLSVCVHIAHTRYETYSSLGFTSYFYRVH